MLVMCKQKEELLGSRELTKNRDGGQDKTNYDDIYVWNTIIKLIVLHDEILKSIFKFFLKEGSIIKLISEKNNLRTKNQMEKS